MYYAADWRIGLPILEDLDAPFLEVSLYPVLEDCLVHLFQFALVEGEAGSPEGAQEIILGEDDPSIGKDLTDV